ncbi:uncharacterized protein CDAR_432381 [Caerostris darwini]|uniref:LolA-like domain-containing protein n=1 Tax=Caerostris darwini TaxID=1538125 RepID=A0AAV4U328_9ARAC|nr:uncharacterized protein CDAR_432381 [Caerostris darwini]
MYAVKQFLTVGILITCIILSSSQEDVRPTFPDVFQVDVQGIFKDENEEVDGTLYYDKVNNRAALYYTYQGDTTKSIYRFNENQLLYIEGSSCTAAEIRADSAGTFFPFSKDKDGKRVLANAEDVFFFTNSTLDRQDIAVFPSLIYTAKLDFPQYQRKDCEVTHIFTKPELKLPDCDTQLCRSTLMAISVRCENPDGELEVDHTYNFFRFRTSISDTNIFLPPSGVFCNVKSQREFPGLPLYFSFSYDLIDEQEESGNNPGVFIVHKKVWYDPKLNILRMDEFDDEGLQIASRIFDLYGGVAYTTIASLSTCEMGPINSAEVSLDEMTRLPKILFVGKDALKQAVYVGTRHIHALDYEVWSLSSEDKETDSRIVQDFYFTKNAPKEEGGKEKLKISHAEIYTYERNPQTRKDELSLFTYLAIDNFISKGFRLKVDGPPTVRDSRTYRDILKRLYLNLIIATNVSVVRLSEIDCVYDGLTITEITGWILEKPNITGSETGKNEPDMNEAYRIIENAAAAGNLTIKIKKDGKEIKYTITAIEDIDQPPKKETKDTCFSGGTLAGASFGLFIFGFALGTFIYYQVKNRRKQTIDYKVHMDVMKG